MSIFGFIKKLMAQQEPQPQKTEFMTRTCTIVMESPITLPVSDQALQTYTSQDYMDLFSDEITERAKTMQTVLNEHRITPLIMKGRIVPITDPSIQHTQNIIIECDITAPDSEKLDSLTEALNEAFEEQYPRLY